MLAASLLVLPATRLTVEPLLSPSFTTMVLLLALAAGLALLIWRLRDRPLNHLDALTVAASLLMAAGAFAFYLSGADPAVLQAPLFAAACLAGGRGIALEIRPRFAADLPAETHTIHQALGTCLLSCAAGGAWLIAGNGALAMTISAAVLALAWPYAPELQRSFSQRAGLAKARRIGVELNGPDAIASMEDGDMIVFDRPSLLSSDDHVVTDVHAFDNRPEPLLAVAATAEKHAKHPLGAAIRAIAADWSVPVSNPDEWEEVPGLGMVAMIGGKSVAVGNADLMKELKVDCFTANSLCRPIQASGKTCLIVAVGQRAVGMIALEAAIHPQASQAITGLHSNGLETLLVTGMEPQTAHSFCQKLKIGNVHSNVRQADRFAVAQSATETKTGFFVSAAANNRRGIFSLSMNPESHGALLATLHDGLLAPLSDLFMLTRTIKKQDRLIRLVTLAISVVAGLLGAVGLLPIWVAPLVFGLAMTASWVIASKLS